MKQLAVVLALICATASAIAAPGDEGSLELGLFGGYGVLDDYAGADPDDGTIWGGRVGAFLGPAWGLEASFQLLSSEVDPGGTDFDIDSVRLAALYNFRPGKPLRPFVTGGFGIESMDSDRFEDDGPGLHVGGGARWYFGQRFGVRLDGRLVRTDVSTTVDAAQTNFETTAGVLVSFGGGSKPAPTAAAAPAAPAPVVAPPSDADGDGVADNADRCPGTAKGCTVDTSGCQKDGDADGVCDGVDRCPDTIRGCTVDATGCRKDGDADGICDGLDQCPNTPTGKQVDGKGCELAFDERGTLRLEGVEFDYDSDRLTPESKSILDRTAASLAEWPELRVEVGGHTDSKGGDAYNQKLSQRRADAVRDYLVNKGVPASRVAARGYGESQPVADNATDGGRSRNRRVELKRLD